jgi:hypothetical protein
VALEVVRSVGQVLPLPLLLCLSLELLTEPQSTALLLLLQPCTWMPLSRALLALLQLLHVRKPLGGALSAARLGWLCGCCLLLQPALEGSLLSLVLLLLEALPAMAVACWCPHMFMDCASLEEVSADFWESSD